MIMKKKICFVLLGLLSLGASAQEDTREEVLEVVATSDISEIIGYAKTVKVPTFTMSEGSMANIPYSMTHWNKKNEDGTWTRYNASTFTEGTYLWLTSGSAGARSEGLWQVVICLAEC